MDLVKNNLLEDLLRNDGCRYQRLDIDDLPAVAQYLSQQGRGLIVINSVPDEAYPMYSYYDADGTRHTVSSFNAALQNVQNPLVLLYTPGHWQAIVRL